MSCSRRAASKACSRNVPDHSRSARRSGASPANLPQRHSKALMPMARQYAWQGPAFHSARACAAASRANRAGSAPWPFRACSATAAKVSRETASSTTRVSSKSKSTARMGMTRKHESYHGPARQYFNGKMHKPGWLSGPEIGVVGQSAATGNLHLNPHLHSRKRVWVYVQVQM